MYFDTWAQTLTQSFRNLGSGVIDFVPDLLAAIVIFIIGWIIAAVIGRVVDQIIKALRVDSALKGAGFQEFLKRAGFNLNSGHFFGELVKWFVIFVFLLASLELLGLNQVTEFLKDVVLLYLPQVIVAVLILVAGVVIADLMRNLVVASAKGMGVRSSNFLGSLTRWAILVFAILASLFQLGIAAAFLQTLFTGIIIALALAFGLSFGLGGQETASRFLERLRNEINDRD